LEDKIVQQGVVTILNEIYEEDFLGFSYGFRPKRGAHQALDALTVGISRKRVNWVLDADIRGFFDNLDHEWMVKFVRHRIRDRRILRLIQKWLKAGVSEEGTWQASTKGTPQGAVISPLLANIYLHYVLDLWAHQWRKKEAKGSMIIVRYADDVVFGFESRDDAERFLEQVRERLAEFGLQLHPDKTRLVAFGRQVERRWRAGKGEKPGTFDFLGFTHMSGRNSKTGYFTVKRKTAGKRLRAKLKEVRKALRVRMHDRIAETGKWLQSVVRGYFNYHAIPENRAALETFRSDIIRAWIGSLRRRGQRRRITWDRFRPHIRRWIPSVRIIHPYPSERFDAIHPR
jgi:group II intron reverse transcriptase/maturase